MSQTQTYRIPLSNSGFSFNESIDSIPPNRMIWPSFNWNVLKSGRALRGGTAHYNAIGIDTDTPFVGTYSFFSDNTRSVIGVTQAGEIWRVKEGAATRINQKNAQDEFVNWTTSVRVCFEVINDVVYMANGNGIPQYWTGSGLVQDLTDLPADWGPEGNYPSIIKKHGRGNSELLWASGLNGNTKMVYYSEQIGSAPGDIVVFAEPIPQPPDPPLPGPGKFIHIETGDNTGITSLQEFGDRIIAFSRSRSYVIEDGPTDSTLWGYTQGQWLGGCIHHHLSVETDNDLVMFGDDGTIYSITAVQQYGDYKKASLTHPSFMDQWILKYVDMNQIEMAHAVYDPVNRCIKFFVPFIGDNKPKYCLVCFMDPGLEDRWTIHNAGFNNDSGYIAYSSCVHTNNNGYKYVVTGSQNGFIWILETSDMVDNGLPYNSTFFTPPIYCDQDRVEKLFMDVWLSFNIDGHSIFTIKIFIDGNLVDDKEIDSSYATGAFYGKSKYGFDRYSKPKTLKIHFRNSLVGKSIQFKFSSTDSFSGINFSDIQIDFKYLSKRY